MCVLGEQDEDKKMTVVKDCGLESDPVYKSARKPMQIAKFCSQIIIKYEQMIKVAIAVQNAVKILADQGKILILLENFVFARGELIYQTRHIGDF